jgi:hypothetical protein
MDPLSLILISTFLGPSLVITGLVIVDWLK